MPASLFGSTVWPSTFFSFRTNDNPPFSPLAWLGIGNGRPMFKPSEHFLAPHHLPPICLSVRCLPASQNSFPCIIRLRGSEVGVQGSRKNPFLKEWCKCRSLRDLVTSCVLFYTSKAILLVFVLCKFIGTPFFKKPLSRRGYEKGEVKFHQINFLNSQNLTMVVGRCDNG